MGDELRHNASYWDVTFLGKVQYEGFYHSFTFTWVYARDKEVTDRDTRMRSSLGEINLFRVAHHLRYAPLPVLLLLELKKNHALGRMPLASETDIDRDRVLCFLPSHICEEGLFHVPIANLFMFREV